MNNQSRHFTILFRVSTAEAFRRGWEDARKNLSFDRKYYDSLTDRGHQTNYEMGRLQIIEGKNIGLNTVPAYCKLDPKRIKTFSNGKPILKVRHPAFIENYRDETRVRLLAKNEDGFINPSKILESKNNE